MYKNKNKGKKLENTFTSYLFGCLAFLVDDWLMLPIFLYHILYEAKKESTRDSFSTQVFINHAEDGSWTHTSVTSLEPESSASAIPPLLRAHL